MTSKKYTLNWMDAGKGLIVAVGTSVLFFVQSSIDSGSMQFHWKGIGMSAISGAVAYLLKNFFTDTKKLPEPGKN